VPVLWLSWPVLWPDRRRIDNEVFDLLGCEKTMEPETIAAGFVAGDDRGCLGQVKSSLGAADFPGQGLDVTCRNVPEDRCTIESQVSSRVMTTNGSA
jgi:hypothetical protein